MKNNIQVAKIEQYLIDLKESLNEIKSTLKDHDNKLDCIDRKVITVRTQMCNHLQHHAIFDKIWVGVAISIISATVIGALVLIF